MTPTFHELKTTGEYIEKASKAMEESLLAAIEKKGTARLALSGGSSPKDVYTKLSLSEEIDWSKVELYLVDERYIDLNSADSNYKMIKDRLLAHVEPPKAFHYFNTALDLDECLVEYEKGLPTDSPFFDLVVLGLGKDGHTASLFPDSEALNETDQKVLHTTTEEFAVRDRLTLSFPTILSSEKIIFAIRGENKREIIKTLMSGSAPINELPASKILEHSKVEIFYEAV